MNTLEELKQRRASLIKEFLSIVIDLWCLIYDTCYQRGLISVQRHKELVEQVHTLKDFQYQPNRKFHRGD